MKSPADLILAELGPMEQIVKAACSVESARCGGAMVDPHDPRIQVLVADMILDGLGEKLRHAVEEADAPVLVDLQSNR